MPCTTAAVRRLRLQVRGTVQGVGFRPYVYRLALELGLAGWVANDTGGVVIEVEADEDVIGSFVQALRTGLPPNARIVDIGAEAVEPLGEAGFRIRPSEGGGPPRALVLPDLAPCPACLSELRDRADRRYGYAFTNCTHCGPRFTIIRELPYDRPRTTMAGFELCAACAAEYTDPLDRRFHAQPNACPACGPRLAFAAPALGAAPAPAAGTAEARAWRAAPGHSSGQPALAAAASVVRGGGILALKGVGGYLLVCDAESDAAVAGLRARKGRPTKPLAVLVPDLAAAARIADVDEAAAALLSGPEAPIVLLPRRPDAGVAAGVAPGQDTLGVMLPAAPLLHLLMDELRGPVVATSGNLSEEPICTDDGEARTRLGGIADAFLTHDRPIQRHVDDSVAWVTDGEARLLRRARGYAPLPIRLAAAVPPLVATGAQLKNVVAVARGRDVFLSQHVGDLQTREAQRAFEAVIGDLMQFYDVAPAAIAHDLHPDYASTQWAVEAGSRLGGGTPLVGVQHHHAHLAACLAEHAAEGPALGVIWDGTGHGADGTAWGGEFLLGDARSYRRVAHLRPLSLPGGDAAAREPERIALSLLHGIHGAGAAALDLPVIRDMPDARRRVLLRLLETGVSAPATTSAGRLFDGVAALLGLARVNRHEGEAAMALEQAAVHAPGERHAYTLPLVDGVLDWRPLVAELLEDRRRGADPCRAAAAFHNALMDAAVRVAEAVGCGRVVLSGGCFQNRLLAGRLPALLRARGFQVLQHRQVPPNDGGIALGQIAVAAATLNGGS